MTQPAMKQCPVCRKPPVETYRPFCSSRCADVDLGRWVSESYAVPAEEMPEFDKPPKTDTEQF